MIRSALRLLPVFTILFAQLSAQTSPPAAPSDPRSFENEFAVSLTMFSTLTAINAAGYDAGLDSPLNEQYKVRRQVREEIAKRKISVLNDLRDFYQHHKKGSESADLGQYVSFALLAGDAPDFELPPGNLPPDVEPLRSFTPLVARFYKEAGLDDLWRRSQPAYAHAMHEYQDSVINTLFEANGYLRNPSGYLGRRFQIYLDLLGAPNEIQVRSYRDDYFVVITPTTAPVIDEIREAYLAYILDPLTFKYSTTIKDKKPLAKYAQDAPALDLAYKEDFSLLVTKCLIKAIDSRLIQGGPEKRAAFVNEAMREGFIMTAGFAELLPLYEKQPDSFRIYYPDLISALDVRKEEKRLKKVEFVQSVAPRPVAPPAKIQLDPVEENLQTADGLHEQHDNENASKLYKKVLEQTSDKTVQSRAYYGLALIALGEKHWDEALNLFQRTVDANPTSPSAAWSHYYLGQLHLKAQEFDEATSQFKMTIATAGVSAKARDAAEKALQTSSSGDKQP